MTLIQLVSIKELLVFHRRIFIKRLTKSFKDIERNVPAEGECACPSPDVEGKDTEGNVPLYLHSRFLINATRLPLPYRRV